MTHGEIVYRSGRNTPLTRQELIAQLTSAAKYGGYEVAWYDGSQGQVPFGMDVDIYAPDRAYFSPAGEAWFVKGAEVNWGALGSGTAERARIYGELLIEAARIVETVNASIKLVTQDDAYAAYKAHRLAVTADHENHTAHNDDCDRCWEIKRAADTEAKEIAESVQKMYQKRANRLTKAADNAWDTVPHGEGRAELVGRMTVVGNCQAYGWRHKGSRRHVMRADGTCGNCGIAIDDMEKLMSLAVAEAAALPQVGGLLS